MPKEITYIKCRKLEEKYEECLKNSILKKDSFPKGNEEIKRRQSVRMAPEHQTFEYEQPKNEDRLTDNSILLQSDRKSMQSETNLLHDVWFLWVIYKLDHFLPTFLDSFFLSVAGV